MGKRRTKKDKVIAQLRRQVKIKNKSQKSSKITKVVEKEARVGKKAEKSQESERDDFTRLFSYNPKLIAEDLKRTLLWSLVAFAIEIGLYLTLR